MLGGFHDQTSSPWRRTNPAETILRRFALPRPPPATSSVLCKGSRQGRHLLCLFHCLNRHRRQRLLIGDIDSPPFAKGDSGGSMRLLGIGFGAGLPAVSCGLGRQPSQRRLDRVELPIDRLISRCKRRGSTCQLMTQLLQSRATFKCFLKRLGFELRRYLPYLLFGPGPDRSNLCLGARKDLVNGLGGGPREIRWVNSWVGQLCRNSALW